MFCIVVVPRHTAITQERKELVAILLEALLAFDGRFAFEIRFVQKLVELVDRDQVLTKGAFPQSPSVNGINHGFQQIGEALGDRFHLFVEGVVQYCVV